MKDKEIIISAGHHLKDPGAMAFGLQENNLCMLFRDHLASELRNLGFRVITPVDQYSLHETIKFAAQFPDVPAIDLHFNAFNGNAKGSEVFSKKADGLGNTLGKVLCDTSAAFGFANRGVKTPDSSARKRLGFLDKIKHGIVFEICFMDNEGDMSLVDEPKEIKAWAKAMATAVNEGWSKITS